MNTHTYHIHKIQEGLSQKQKSNPSYSLRAYARDLGMHPATLSQVMKGQRPLPIKNSHLVVDKLSLGPKEKTLFLESLYRSKTTIDSIKIDENDERFMLDESYYKVIAEWEHYAVLTLFDVDSFDCSIDEVSKRLGITTNRSQVVIENLLTSGLLKLEDGKYIKTQKHVRTTEDISSKALRESHLETLDIGKQKLDEIEVGLRDFSAMTIAVDPEKLTEAKTIIREFRQKMAALLRDGSRQDVYQLAIQFYPLTQIQNAEK
ncbi:MAG: DUF4423 domain-containing protein [Bacteriovoracaceae bacterium]